MTTEKLVKLYSTWSGVYVCSDECAEQYRERYPEEDFVFADDHREYIFPCAICGNI